MVSFRIRTLSVTEVAVLTSKDTDPCLILGSLSFIRNDEVTGFSDLRPGYVRPLQFIFPLPMTESSKYQLPRTTFSRLGSHRVSYKVYSRA